MSECSNSMDERPEVKKLSPNWFQFFLYGRGETEGNMKMLSPSDCSLNSLRENHTDQPAFWEIKCKTLDELQGLFEKRSGLVFRGQASANWKLDSSLLRLMKKCGMEIDGAVPIDIASKSFGPLVFDNHLRRNFPDSLERASKEQMLAFAQHYGYPTNLLDWTESLDKALFFAFEQASRDDCDEVAVFAIDIGKMYILEYCDKNNSWPPDRTNIVNARDVLAWLNDRYINEQFDHWMFCRPGNFWDIRMAIQETVLSVQSWQVSLEESLTFHEDCDDTLPKPLPKTLVKISLPAHMRPKVMKYLEGKGISRGTLFPNLDALCATAKSELMDHFLEQAK